MSYLDARQRHALAQLQDLTNGGDDDVAISVLDSVGWDVQVRQSKLLHSPANS
jgi:FAS-associated factor 2